ncbi:Tudor and KH domain-containing protein-like protein, partial [Leptotrombidium deliense]
MAISSITINSQKIDAQVDETEAAIRDLNDVLCGRLTSLKRVIEQLCEQNCDSKRNFCVNELNFLRSKMAMIKKDILERPLNVSNVSNESNDCGDEVESFRRKLTVNTNAATNDEFIFEIDSSPENERRMDQHLANRVNRPSELSASVTEAPIVDEDLGYDYEADIKWKEELFSMLDEHKKKDKSQCSSRISFIDGASSKSKVQTNSETISSQATKIKMVKSVPIGTTVCVWPGFVVNPSRFWLHYNPSLNDKIHIELQRTQNMVLRSGKWRVDKFEKGMYVAGTYTQDHFWYRALIKNIIGRDENDKIKVEVFYIDYGNTEVLTEDEITFLSPEFYNYEPQAVRCIPSNIPLNTEWSQKAINEFKSIVDNASNKCLTAYF